MVEFYTFTNGSIVQWYNFPFSETVSGLCKKAKVYNYNFDSEFLVYYLTHFDKDKVFYYYYNVLYSDRKYNYSTVIDKLKFDYYMYAEFVMRQQIKSKYPAVLKMVDRLNVVLLKRIAMKIDFPEFMKKYENIEVEKTECVVCYELTLRYTNCYHRLCAKCESQMRANVCPMCRVKL
jgi:hypothetical protein